MTPFSDRSRVCRPLSTMATIDLTLKCQKKDNKPLDKLEKEIAEAMIDIQNSNTETKMEMRELIFHRAQELQIRDKRVILIYIPVPQLRMYRQVQEKLTRELEKKFPNRFILFVAFRRILPKPMRGSKKSNLQKQKRPRSRTLSSVHEAILGDLVFPSEIVGKRQRVKLDGKRLLKVHLDKNKQTNIEHKIDAIGQVYKELTGKDVVFEFPEPIF